VILVAGHGAGDERVRPRRLPPKRPRRSSGGSNASNRCSPSR